MNIYIEKIGDYIVQHINKQKRQQVSLLSFKFQLGIDSGNNTGTNCTATFTDSEA